MKLQLQTDIPRIVYREGVFLCNIEVGESWAVHEPTGGVIIVHPDKRPRVINIVNGLPLVTEL